MAVRTSFTAGEVLAAADLTDTFGAKVDYALPVNAQTGSGASAYTFVLADGLRLTSASNASAATYTIPPQSSVIWLANSVIRVVNYGAGAVTIAGGAGVTVTNATKTLAQFESAALIRTASNAWTLVPFGGGVSALRSTDVSGTTGSPTISTYTSRGVGYTVYKFTGSGSITTAKTGNADLLLAGGGGGGGYGGGGSGSVLHGGLGVVLNSGTSAVTIGAGGTGGYPSTSGSTTSFAGIQTGSPIASPVVGGGGGAFGTNNGNAPGGGGSTSGSTGGAALSGQTFAGGAGAGTNGVSQGGGGGGGVGSAGSNGSANVGGAGGSGTVSLIETGSAVGYGGGGGGGGVSSGGSATNGGGAGGSGTGIAGTANTGGGGGGAGVGSPANGGSGVVIIRVLT